MTPMGAGRDISYVSNQMMESDARAQKQLESVKTGLHGKIEDHLDAVTIALSELEKTVIGAIGVSQEERRAALQNVSEQISKFERHHAEETNVVLESIAAINRQLSREISAVNNAVWVLNTNLRNDFWKLFFTSIWRSVKGIF